jgi:hypothetical protein
MAAEERAMANHRRSSHRMIAVLLSVNAVLLAAIPIAIVLRPTPERNQPATRSSKREMMDAALSQPPLRWVSDSTDWLGQKADFGKWSQGKMIIPEVSVEIDKWLTSVEAGRNEPDSISKVVTNYATGATYEVTGARTMEGATCTITFVGNTNWK